MKNNRGVALAELAIVLAIIAVLVAAVAEGFNLRRSAEIRGFLTDLNTFQVAVEGFDLKYSDLPGDMSDAFTYWDNGANTICGTATQCNGNSDGQIAIDSGGSDSEAYRAWQHLVLSEFLGGGYTGSATGTQADIGINIPESKRTSVGYSLGYANTGDGSRNEINLGAFYIGNVNTNPALTPQEAFAIDKKIDDGAPGTGLVHGVDGNGVTATNCALTSTTYNSTITSTSCRQTFPVKP